MGKRAAPPSTPDDIIRKLMEPAVKIMVRRGEMICEEVFRQATNAALEQAAIIAERFFVEDCVDVSPMIRERLTRQNKVAAEIAECIRAEILREPSDV